MREERIREGRGEVEGAGGWTRGLMIEEALTR